MLHFILSPELRVFILERVVTMRARCDDLPNFAAGERLDIGPCAFLEKELVTDSPRGVAGARLLFAEHREVHSCLPEQLHRRTRDLLRAWIERRSAPDPEQIFEA